MDEQEKYPSYQAPEGRVWWNRQFAANTALHHGEALMEDWLSQSPKCSNPFLGRYSIGHLDWIWEPLTEKIDNLISKLPEFGYPEGVCYLYRERFDLLLTARRAGARPGDAIIDTSDHFEPPSAPFTPWLPDDKSESPIERALAIALVKFGLFCDDPLMIGADCAQADGYCGIFIYQQATVLKYRADFLLGAMASPGSVPHWVVVECDGHEFHERTAEQAEHDRARDRAMTAAGYRVFRFTGREIQRDARRCANEVLAYLRPFARSQS
jgi:very-short-patch-repair endonuclease